MKTKLQLQILFLFLSMIIGAIAKAEVVEPVFTGYWMSDAINRHQNACLADVFEYINLQPSYQAIANSKMSNPRIYSDCQWGNIFYMRNPLGPFEGYPGYPPDDWFLRTQTDLSIVVPMWAMRSCVNSTGQVLKSISTEIYPQYVCPAGSVLGIDRFTKQKKCTTTPMACYADIVGRDLNDEFFNFLGHVGLASYPDFKDGNTESQVIEVLNDAAHPGIFKNKLEDFKHVPNFPYWGEKGGIKENPDLSAELGDKIVQIAKSQMQYPFEYTLDWDWHPGGIGEQEIYDQNKQEWYQNNSVRSAKFRCDSLVYFSYLAGANLYIFPVFVELVTPVAMFNAFLSCNDFEGTVCGNQKIQSFSTITPAFTLPVPSVTLTTIFSAPSINLKEAEYVTRRYVADNNIPRTIKLNQLWLLALKHQANPEKFNYLVTKLEYLKPIELTDEFIQQFYLEKSNQNKRKLLNVIIDSLQNETSTDLTRIAGQVANVVKAQNFVRDILYQSQDRYMLRYALMMYASIVPVDVAAKDIEKSLNRQDVMNLKPALLTEEEKFLLDLRMAFSTQEQQKKTLPQLIQENKNNTVFNDSLCFVLNDLSPERIDSQVKVEISQLLELKKDDLIARGFTLPIQGTGSLCNWLGAYATVMTQTKNDKDKFMLSYIRKEPDVFVKAKLLSGLNWKLMKQMTPADRAYYKSLFYGKLNNQLPSFDSKNINVNNEILKSGISSLYQPSDNIQRK